MTHLAWWPCIVLAGAGVGVCTGLFGVGGSSVATPVLALLGAPGLIAVASPLPATIPSAAVGAIPYVRSHEARTRAAAWSVLGAAACAGAGPRRPCGPCPRALRGDGVPERPGPLTAPAVTPEQIAGPATPVRA
jgi:Sulfite exporter TauE/SafE